MYEISEGNFKVKNQSESGQNYMGNCVKSPNFKDIVYSTVSLRCELMKCILTTKVEHLLSESSERPNFI